MHARRPALVTFSLLLALVPATSAAAGQKRAPFHAPGVEDRAATRQEIVAGTATREQRLDLLRASIDSAGGTTLAAAEVADDDVIGGYSYPLVAADLDGNGDDEVLLEQFARREYVVALDDGEVMWRLQQPPKSYVIGALVGDVFSDAGEEVLIILYRWKADKVVIGGAGEHGLRWTLPLDSYHTELNGLVQADSDQQSEIAISSWDEEDGDLTIQTVDGESGMTTSSIGSTPDGLLDGSFTSDGFITDGPEGGADEAVFITALGGGYYAERRSLEDGTQSTFDIFPDANPPEGLFQGPDYTGDGRRDAFLSVSTLVPESSWELGVFDAGTLETAWTMDGVDPFFLFFYPPFSPGDADGDGGQDLCLFLHDDQYDDQDNPISSTSTFRCHSGKTGTQLWESSKTVSEPENGWAHTDGLAMSDLNGDDVTDPILESFSSTCTGPEEEAECDYSYTATAISGKNGSVLWTVDGLDSYGLAYDLTASNLDQSPGDDLVQYAYRENGVAFEVRNGLSLTRSWQGEFDAVGEDGYVDGALEADLDGDGTTEAFLTASSYEGIGEPECEVYEGEEYCWYEDYLEYAYAGAFETGGALLWTIAL
jgi:hypothetical protein